MATSPKNTTKAQNAALNVRVRQCRSAEFDWEVIPERLREGCKQAARAISIPPIAMLAGLLLTVCFSMSHSVVEVEGIEWVEPVLLWIAVCMPTGSGKSALCKFLKTLVEKARANCGLSSSDPSWCLDDQSFEKMGALMAENDCKLLGLYDELAMFLSQINVFRGRGLSDSHELALFLQLYSASPWTRRTVSGDANFTMHYTGMTLGGFIQPGPARSLLEIQSNVEKGLCQRFLWLCPSATIVKFDQLQQIDKEFSSAVANLMSIIWKPDKSVQKWVLPRRPVGSSDVQEMMCGHFQQIYDVIQEKIMAIGCMDELLSGMLSKSKGQILRIAAVMHVLFHMDTPTFIPTEISEAAMRAADSFVEYCLQHAAYLGGRGDLNEAIEEFKKVPTTINMGHTEQDHRVAAYCLLLPGKKLHLSALLVAKRFRDKGNKDGALKAFRVLQGAGLGEIQEVKAHRGAPMTFYFEKSALPTDEEDKVEFSSKLLNFGVSLTQYKESLEQEEITLASIESKKRLNTNSLTPIPRKSPRKSPKKLE